MKALFDQAHEAGMKAVESLQVVPMVVNQHANMFDDSSPVVNSWVVPDGPCGFAWVNIKPANGKFAKFMLKEGYARKDSYYGGISYWISAFNQSVQKKETYARAFAKVLSDNGIKAYSASRLD